MNNPSKGDYVLTSKYHDGDPKDQWSIGFYDRFEGDRHYVVASKGQQFRYNGFRRVAKLSKERGKWILAHQKDIELSGKSIWHFYRCSMQP